MRVLHLIDHWGLGGAQRVVATLTRLETQHQHHIAAVFKHDQHPWHTPIQPLFLTQSYKGLPGAIRMLRRHIRQLQPDLIHVHLYGARFVTHLALLGMRRKPRIVWHEHSEGEIYERFPPLIAKLLLVWQKRQAKRIIFASPTQSGTNFLRRTFPLKEQNLFVLPNPVDCRAIRKAAEFASPLDRPQDAPVIAFMGRLVKQKGAELVLPIFRKFCENAPGAQLWVVGDGPLKQSMQKQAQSLQLEQATTFFGSRTDVESIINSVDLIIMPSAYEPFGMIAAEAFCLNKPVVGNAVDGLGELLNDHPLGHPVETNNRDQFVVSMVNAIHQKLDQPPLATPYWDADLAVPKWTQFYENCAPNLV